MDKERKEPLREFSTVRVSFFIMFLVYYSYSLCFFFSEEMPKEEAEPANTEAEPAKEEAEPEPEPEPAKVEESPANEEEPAVEANEE